MKRCITLLIMTMALQLNAQNEASKKEVDIYQIEITVDDNSEPQYLLFLKKAKALVQPTEDNSVDFDAVFFATNGKVVIKNLLSTGSMSFTIKGPNVDGVTPTIREGTLADGESESFDYNDKELASANQDHSCPIDKMSIEIKILPAGDVLPPPVTKGVITFKKLLTEETPPNLNKLRCEKAKDPMDLILAEGFYKDAIEKGVYIENDVVYVFIGPDKKLLGKTKFPTTLPENKAYQYKIYVVMKKDDLGSEKLKLGITGTPYNPKSKNSFNVYISPIESPSSTSGGNGATEDEPEYCLLYTGAEPVGPFSDRVTFKVELGDEVYYQRSCDLTLQKTYIASIVGGFYVSTLNNPQNIQKFELSSGTTTLIGDNTSTQRALTVMALFYPRPRTIDYMHKDLSFMQKWGFVFGTKLSDNIFDDLLLGLNYEFSKGASFSAGIHYGEHNVIAGYRKFDFGSTHFTQSDFNNTMVLKQWDPGLFVGVTVDFSVISAIGRGFGDRRVQQKDYSKSTATTDDPKP